MTRLLVSVRDLAEARLAQSAGADLIDLKEPRRGPLGRVDPAIVRGVVGELQGSVPLSAALGELPEWESFHGKLRRGELAIESTRGLSFVKLGLAGCAARPEWPRLWREALAQLPVGPRHVAVVYADAAAAGSPPAEEILRHAAALGCVAVLVDTWDKTGPGLVELWPRRVIEDFVGAVHAQGMLIVLAGRLTADDVGRVAALGPDYVAVRGAACGGPRDGALDGDKVSRLVALLKQQVSLAAARE